MTEKKPDKFPSAKNEEGDGAYQRRRRDDRKPQQQTAAKRFQGETEDIEGYIYDIDAPKNRSCSQQQQRE